MAQLNRRQNVAQQVAIRADRRNVLCAIALRHLSSYRPAMKSKTAFTDTMGLPMSTHFAHTSHDSRCCASHSATGTHGVKSADCQWRNSHAVSVVDPSQGVELPAAALATLVIQKSRIC